MSVIFGDGRARACARWLVYAEISRRFAPPSDLRPRYLVTCVKRVSDYVSTRTDGAFDACNEVIGTNDG